MTKTKRMEITDKSIYSNRLIKAPLQQVYEAFANPALLAKWWGPEGFSNTIHEFDLRPGGKCRLTMHGPEKGNYENAALFNKVLPLQLISWTRLTAPYFDMELLFEEIEPTLSRIAFHMIFGSVEECEKMKKFVVPKNEENFDRLERLLQSSL